MIPLNIWLQNGGPSSIFRPDDDLPPLCPLSIIYLVDNLPTLNAG